MSTAWCPTQRWRRQHKQSKVYRVRVRARIDERAWANLEKENSSSDGSIGLGGVSLTRVSENEVDAISGGEDAFDSLEYAINEVLARVASDREVVEEEELKNW